MSASALLAGVDVGGTKCAVVLGRGDGGAGVEVLADARFPTPGTPGDALAAIADAIARLLDGAKAGGGDTPALAAVGVSCGGPLDSRRGLVLSPPNLPGWDGIDVVSPLASRFGVPVALRNDADAGALAEWRWGAGRGTRNFLFLTFGTGMGAGLILDGRLHSGANGLAGEVGHVRLAPRGPLGHGKAGSFEGFCSGGGIRRLAMRRAGARLRAGDPPLFCPSPAALESVTARAVAEAAHAGDPLAREVFEEVARRLGQGLAVLVDVLNPECIALGSIYVRQRALLEPGMQAALRAEALPQSLAACRVVPAELGERIGDMAALAVALEAAATHGRGRVLE